MTGHDTQVDRIESAANITLIISQGAESGSSDGASMLEVPISQLDTTKEVEISEVRENTLKANGYSVTSISYSGSMNFAGTRFSKGGQEFSLDDLLYDENGVPVPVSINIQHDLDEEAEVYEHVLVTSEGYEVRSEETTETSYDWIAMDRQSDQPN